MILFQNLPVVRCLNVNIIQTSFPLIISILSYPLFAAFSLSVISRYFPSSISYFILGQAILTIFIRFSENLLSGTRVLTAQNFHEPVEKRTDIFKVSWNISIWLSVVGITTAFIFWLVSYLFISNAYCLHLSYTILCLTAGLPGIFLYNTCACYLHAHKKTHSLPVISWIANFTGITLMYLYASSQDASFLCCLLIASFSRWILAFLACLVIPTHWKGDKFYRIIFSIKEIIRIMQFGFSHAINSLFFTGSYFLFSLFLELNASDELPVFQIQLSLLGIFSVINSAIINSGCIISTQIEKSNLKGRKKLIIDNFTLNIIVVSLLLILCYFFRQSIVDWMGVSSTSAQLFLSTFVLFAGIYVFDILQMILIQVMTYNNDYLIPPLMRIAVFALTSIPLAFMMVHFFDQGLSGLLVSILTGTIISCLFIVNYFKANLKHTAFLSQ